MTVARLRVLLFSFYAATRADGRPIDSELGDFFPETLGARHAPGSIKSKGGETEGLSMFTAKSLIPDHGVRIPNYQLILRGAQALSRFNDTTETSGWRLTIPAYQSLWDHFHGFCKAAELLEIPSQPKLHLWMHMVHRFGYSGFGVLNLVSTRGGGQIAEHSTQTHTCTNIQPCSNTAANIPARRKAPTHACPR